MVSGYSAILSTRGNDSIVYLSMIGFNWMVYD